MTAINLYFFSKTAIGKQRFKVTYDARNRYAGRCPEFCSRHKYPSKIQTATDFLLLPSSAAGSGRKRSTGLFLPLLTPYCRGKRCFVSSPATPTKSKIRVVQKDYPYFGRSVEYTERKCQAFRRFVRLLVGKWLTFKRFYAFNANPALLKYSSTLATFSFWKLSKTSE